MMSKSVSKSTQYESPSYNSTSRTVLNSRKKGKWYEPPIVYDYVNLEDSNDIERLKLWCLSQWFGTIRKALLNRNQMKYHLCCNSFSRRYFCRSSDHPVEETYELGKLPEFRNMEGGEDLFRWQLSMIKENARHNIRTLFPSINTRHFVVEDGHVQASEVGIKAQMKRKCMDLERELDEHRRLITNLQAENTRLLRSSKSWHNLYEEMLNKREPQFDLLSTPPVKRLVTNSFVFLEDN